MHNFYNFLQRRNDNSESFIDFLEYMIETSKYIHNEECKDMRDDFDYHFNRIPIYTRDRLRKSKDELRKTVETVSISARRMDETIIKNL